MAKNFKFVAIKYNSFFEQVEEDNLFEVGSYCLNLSYPFSQFGKAILSAAYHLSICLSLLDIDECSEAHAVKLNKCHPNASCINTKGSYNCQCNPTYTGNGFKCKGTFGFFEVM